MKVNVGKIKAGVGGTTSGRTRQLGAGRRSLAIKSILVPIDFSRPSLKALDYAIPFAQEFGARVTLLHVMEPAVTPDFASSFPLMMETDELVAKLKERLEQVAMQRAIKPPLMGKPIVIQGRSFHEIAMAAKSLKADLIIIATHGHTGLKHTLLGSTTERVVRYAPCPVLVVRQREHEFIRSGAVRARR